MLAELAGWDSFFFMVGSSAAGLIGLTFIVLTLLAGKPLRGMAEAGAAFLTPTIVHFGIVLLLCALLLIPWETIGIPAAAWGITGLGGIAYEGITAFRMRRQTVYNPEPEDWLFHVALPLAAYAVLTCASFASSPYLNGALLGVGIATLLLLFTGIHNAWDNVSYHVFFHRNGQE